MQIQISWLLQKPTDLDLHCLQKQGISWFSRTRVKWQYATNIKTLQFEKYNTLKCCLLTFLLKMPVRTKIALDTAFQRHWMEKLNNSLWTVFKSYWNWGKEYTSNENPCHTFLYITKKNIYMILLDRLMIFLVWRQSAWTFKRCFLVKKKKNNNNKLKCLLIFFLPRRLNI